MFSVQKTHVHFLLKLRFFSSSIDNTKETSHTRDDDATKESKEQYVTVITLNDSTYGEIQRTKHSSDVSTSESDVKLSQTVSNNNNNLDDSDNNVAMNNSQSEALQSNNFNCEPIYLNTLESHNKTNCKFFSALFFICFHF